MHKPMSVSPSLLVLLLVLGSTGCNENVIGVDDPPNVTINLPENGGEVVGGTTVHAEAKVEVAGEDTVPCTWTFDGEESCSGDSIATGDSICDFLVDDALKGRDDVILEVTCTDRFGQEGADAITLSVSSGLTPVVTLVSPSEGESYRSDELISFEGTVDPLDDEITALSASWLLWYGDPEAEEALDVNCSIGSTGNILGTAYIPWEGEQQVCLVVEDPAENEGYACAMVTITSPNSPPTCEISSPTDNSTGASGQLVNFEAQVYDPDQPLDTLDVTWYSNLDGELGTSFPNATGAVVFPYQSLSDDTHQIACEVADNEGATGNDSITYTAGGGCSLAIDSPDNLGVYGLDELIEFSATFHCDVDLCAPASVVWESDVDGPLYDLFDPCETAFIRDDLTRGVHTIRVTVTDTSGRSNSDKVFISIDDCSSTWYRDLDGDGYGDALDYRETCTTPSGYVSNSADCDDSSATVNPGAIETCNGIDDNCNGSTDEGFSPATWYQDLDGDEYGDPTAETMESCVEISGWVTNATDCDDANPAINPLAEEACDLVDNDCDTTVDEGFTFTPDTIWYRDLDGDGYGISTATTTGCEPPDGYVNNDDDCDDADATASPALTEQCNGKDDDCDGTVDEADFAGAPTWYYDADLDGYGVTSTGITTCDPSTGYVAGYGDCDDGESDVFPTAPEACDGVDNDCDGTVDDGYSYPAPTEWYRDADEDGYGISGAVLTGCEPPPGFVNNAADCDDANSAANPGQVETCTTVGDDDCDGSANEADSVDATHWYLDADADGYGETSTGVVRCDNPGGYVEQWGDCDDAVADNNPGAAEVCDAADNDCDGVVDEGFAYPFGTVLYQDLDGDGYGTSTVITSGCDPETGWSPTPGDCDDDSTEVNPGQAEVCDSQDNDCDGTVDVAAVDAETWYTDGDSDGYGDTSTAEVSCLPPEAKILQWGDCNDADSTVNPATAEICDGLDQNCNGVVDDGFPFPYGTIWYSDGDGDGYGTEGGPRYDCETPDGYAINADDCDDADSSVNPGQADLCDMIDNNCDDRVDEVNEFTPTWYSDGDGDGYGLTDLSLVACTAPADYASEPGDCDDEKADINPGMEEVCDGIDNDCGDDLDEDFPYPHGTTWYLDGDGDGYGASGAAWPDCEFHEGYVVLSGDCNDAVASVNPAATDVCDRVDNNCDGVADEANDFTPTWYVDADADGYGDTSTATRICTAPAGSISTWGDCDDSSPGVNPAAPEVCDGVDNDCDTFVDEADASGTATWYRDSDGDGFGNATASQIACEAPTGYVADATDCDDYASAAHPGGVEVCDTSDTDEDCDGLADDEDSGATGQLLWYADADADGFGSPSRTTTACDPPSGYANNDDDCDDGASSGYYVNPTVAETCNGIDDDCDGMADDADTGGVSGASTWYTDADTDGYGAASSSRTACVVPTGYVATYGDCNDASAAINPDATDTVADGVDQDCDGWETCYLDYDNDGYRTTSTFTSTDGDCSDTREALSTEPTGDCDDTEADANPGETEACDSIDNDCDGTTDEASATGCKTWYYDKDDDGYGKAGSSSCLCSSSGYYRASNDDDCLDTDANVYLGAPGDCRGIDSDCSGSVDSDEANPGESSTCAVEDCVDLVAENPSAASGRYYIEPPAASSPYEVYCVTSSTWDGTGWTLVMVSSDDGQDTWTWDNRGAMGNSDTSTVGSLSSTDEDFKSAAYHDILFDDILFIHRPSGRWASYSPGDGTRDLGTFIDGIGGPNTYSGSEGYPMIDGTISSGTGGNSLWSTDLFFNAKDNDGAWAQHSWGPTWDAQFNDRCHFDDAAMSGLGPNYQSTSTEGDSTVIPVGFGRVEGLNTGTTGAAENYIQVYVR